MRDHAPGNGPDEALFTPPRYVRGQCQHIDAWPGDGPWSYCGRPVARPGGSWCAQHHAIVFARPDAARPRRASVLPDREEAA